MLLLCRNGLIALAAITVIVQGAVFPADAQSIKRIETLWATTHETAAPYVRALEEGLASYGWLAGKNLVIRHNFTNAQPEKLDHYAAEIVARKPDLIWASLNTAALALKRQTATVPIVIGNAVDPVGVGLAESFNRPGGNHMRGRRRRSDSICRLISDAREDDFRLEKPQKFFDIGLFNNAV